MSRGGIVGGVLDVAFDIVGMYSVTSVRLFNQCVSMLPTLPEYIKKMIVYTTLGIDYKSIRDEHGRRRCIRVDPWHPPQPTEENYGDPELTRYFRESDVA